MKQFLETICIREGIPRHLEWHQRRVDATIKKFFPAHLHSWKLHDCIEVPNEFLKGLARCRIQYDAHYFSIQYCPYLLRDIKTLKIVGAPLGLEYSFKYAERSNINALYDLKEDCDDILISRNDWVTDTSIANIAFLGEKKWYTPSLPLLAGTTWKRLVSEGIIFPRPIHREEITSFKSFKIFNALIDFEESIPLPTNYIKTEWGKS